MKSICEHDDVLNFAWESTLWGLLEWTLKALIKIMKWDGLSVNKIIEFNNLWCYLRSHGDGQQGWVSDKNLSMLNSEGPWSKRFMLALKIINPAKSVCIIIYRAGTLLLWNKTKQAYNRNRVETDNNRVQTQKYAFHSCFIMLKSQFDLELISWPSSQHFDIWHGSGQWPVTSDQWPPCLLTSHLGGLVHAAPLASTLLARR